MGGLSPPSERWWTRLISRSFTSGAPASTSRRASTESTAATRRPAAAASASSVSRRLRGPMSKRSAGARVQRLRHRVDSAEVRTTSLAAGKKPRIISSRSSVRPLIMSSAGGGGGGVVVSGKLVESMGA
uniref:Uncharacterized protein n=1 Tax=Oryza glumipatula TaxID=40148 RepID=A0A0E0BTG4_9ORYZ